MIFQYLSNRGYGEIVFANGGEAVTITENPTVVYGKCFITKR